MDPNERVRAPETVVDHSSAPEFLAEYATKDESPEALSHFARVRDCVARVRRQAPDAQLDVVDIGCAAGALARVFAAAGHRVRGLDVNQPLLDLARQRSRRAGLHVQFDLGTAEALPYADASADVCVMLELLEHVPDWKRCLGEAARVLRADGVLFLTTSNRICPVQHEFNLPGYSWYPAPLKRRIIRLTRGPRPDLANFARYPAVNWFSFSQLADELRKMGLDSMDRFDLAGLMPQAGWRAVALRMGRAVPMLRVAAQLFTAGTTLVGVKRPGARRA